MGYFLRRILATLPVLAVVDASSMAGTFGALAFGLQHYRPDMPWAGVLANRVASERHAHMLEHSVRDPAHFMGAVMRNAAMTLPERHLGLTVASEVTDAMERLDAAADAVAATPLGRMSLDELQRWAVDFAAPEVALPIAPGGWAAGRSAPCPPPALRAPPLPAQNTQPKPFGANHRVEVCTGIPNTLVQIRMAMCFAKVKEEPARRAGDTQQNASPP